MKVIIIGCTHAGTAAIKSILDNHPDAYITVYERNDNISFLSCGIALYIGGIVNDPESFFYATPKDLIKLGVHVKMNFDVIDIDTENKKVIAKDLQTKKNERVSYDKLIITTGSWPIIPKIKGIESNNVLLCKNYNHAKLIVEGSKNAKNITIVGAGYIGIELVEAFSSTGKAVTLIDGLNHVLSKYLDEKFSQILENELTKRGVKLILGEIVKGFDVNKNGTVENIITNKQCIKTDLVIICVGFKPTTELLAGKVDMLENGSIMINNYMQTSMPDIFAAGDCAAVNYNPSEHYEYIPLATNAVRQGMLVGYNLLENKIAYKGTQGTSGLYLFNWKIGSTGMTYANAKTNHINVEMVYLEDNYRPEFMPTTERIFMILIYEKMSNRIVGAQLISKYDITQSINTLSVVIQNKMTIEDLALTDFFFQPHFNRPWNYLNLIAQKALKQILNK